MHEYIHTQLTLAHACTFAHQETPEMIPILNRPHMNTTFNKYAITLSLFFKN